MVNRTPAGRQLAARESLIRSNGLHEDMKQKLLEGRPRLPRIGWGTACTARPTYLSEGNPPPAKRLHLSAERLERAGEHKDKLS